MRILVTGGSGFVGRALVPALVAEGHTVVALARSAAARATVQALIAQAAHGDLQDAASLRAALAGCKAVVHAAAAFTLWGDPAHFEAVNVVGTAALLAAAQASGVRRFVMIGAASAIAGGVPAHNVDETYRPPAPSSDDDSRTKLLAEQRVLAANSPTMTTLVLRPPLIWGQGHTMIDAIRTANQSGRWLWIGGGAHRLSTVHITNLCAAVLAALEHGAGGQAYFVTDGPAWTVRAFLEAWLGAQGITLGQRSVPRWAAHTAATLLARVWRRWHLDGAPPITPGMVFMLGTELSVDDTRARHALGYRPPTTIEDGLRQLAPLSSTANPR